MMTVVVLGGSRIPPFGPVGPTVLHTMREMCAEPADLPLSPHLWGCAAATRPRGRWVAPPAAATLPRSPSSVVHTLRV
eukprot:3301557-Prymnesium_polylepis.1